MSLVLSPYAIHRILHFVDNNGGHDPKVEHTRAEPAKNHPRYVNGTWNYVYTRYFVHSSPPPMDFLRSVELALFLGTDLDLNGTRTAFQKPLVFDMDRPRQFVPKIVEGFQRLQEEPLFLDVTLIERSEGAWPSTVLATVWPQVYIDYMPCGACTNVEQERLVVERFHIPSKHYDRKLTVELHFSLRELEHFGEDDVRPETAPGLEKNKLRQVTIRLGNRSCNGSLSRTARRSKSMLLLPEFATGVYGFLDRAHVGASLLANSAVSELIFKLRHLLPVHHLSLTFEEQFVGHCCRRYFRGNYLISLRRFQRDLPYSDLRRFEAPSKDGPAALCSLVRRHLSNSHLFYFKTPNYDSRFALKMLAALADQNFSIDALQMLAGGGGLTDYRSLDTVFGGVMRLDTLELSIFEHKFASLVKTTDFFNMATIQRLKALKLQLQEPWKVEKAPRRLAVISSPLWIAGIRLLHNSERYEVKYESERHLRTIGAKLAQFCEKFERAEITELVQHFKFATSCPMTFPFKAVNKTASKLRVGGYKWDVYRFRNATTDDCITACVGRELRAYSTSLVLHIVKGEAHPDASFAA